jgi:PAP2 superfamily protein
MSVTGEAPGRFEAPRVDRAFRVVSAVVRARFWELGVLVLLFVAYNVVRALPSTTAEIAVEHAQRVLTWEGPLFSHLERPLNRWLAMTSVPAVAACYFYAGLHYLATPAVLLMARRRGGWPYWRGYWTLVLASALALVGYAVFPTAPPRLVPSLGIVDVMRSYADFGWWGSAASAPRGIGDATNQYAAMPSMHFGWALWCAIQMWGFGSRPWRVLATVYPSALVVIVLATGNHFVVDVLVGGACVVAAQVTVEIAHRARTRGWRPGPSPAVVAGPRHG